MKGAEYEVQLFQGNHSNEYLISEMKDGKVEGRCQLFNRGILSLAWTMKDGKRIGGITEYENGIALQKESWESIIGKGDRRVIENSNEGFTLTIRHRCNNENENEETVIYRGEFDEEMNRDGYGIEYDAENGKEKIEGYWEKDKLIRIVREFDPQNNRMIEYAENNNNIDLLDRIPVYSGGYCIVNGKFVRNGVGYVIDGESGTAIRRSEMRCGEERYGGTDLFEGWYVEGMSESIRSVLKNKNPKERKMDPIANLFTKYERVSKSQDLNNMSLIVTELSIDEKCCNDLYALDLSKFKWLHSVRIGNECFEKVQTFKIYGLCRLKTITIGHNSFTKKSGVYGSDLSRSFHILNCESLESIQIGKYSFSDFAGDFELKNLPQLRSIQIGTIGWNSYNFCCSSFVIRGIEMLLNIVMIRSSKSTFHYIR